MHKNLFIFAQRFLASAKLAELTPEKLDDFEHDCEVRARRAKGIFLGAEVRGRPAKPDYLPWKQTRARAQHELSVLVPALREVRRLRQHLAKGKRVSVYELTLRLLCTATRTARPTLLQSPQMRLTRFGKDSAYFTAQCITSTQAELATELLKAHPALFGVLPEELILEVPLDTAQFEMDRNVLVKRKKALADKILAQVTLSKEEQELLRRFLG